jgi:hypothetical protein
VRFGPRFGPTGSGQTNTSRTRENSKKRDAFFSQDTQEIAVGDEPETIYMVTSGTHYNNECCFDYGNAEVSAKKRPLFLVQQLPADEKRRRFTKTGSGQTMLYQDRLRTDDAKGKHTRKRNGWRVL